MDSAPPEVAERSLRDLARLNRWFGGHRALRGVLRRLAPPGQAFSVLDVGAASGDMGRAVRAAFPQARVVSLDHRITHLERAAAPRLVADAFRPPFAGRSFDFVLCSLLLHHFTDQDAARMLRGLLRLPRRALIVLDLERHPLAWAFLPLTRRLLGWSDLTVSDGCLSVAASFTGQELLDLARRAGARQAEVRQHRPWFRLSLVMEPPPNVVQWQP